MFCRMMRIPIEVELDAEVKAPIIALYQVSLECIRVGRIFINNSEILKLITTGEYVKAWCAH